MADQPGWSVSHVLEFHHVGLIRIMEHTDWSRILT